MRKAVLIEFRDGMVLFPQKMPGAEEVTAPSCKTCKWSSEHEEWWKLSDSEPDPLALEYPLRCELADQAGGEPTHRGRLCVTLDGSNYRGELYVKPDFGCVQWEGRE